MSHPYCTYVATITDTDDVDKVYHDNHYGVPIYDDNELFCRLVLEINQAGLSWRTILIKEKYFRTAFSNFDIKTVAKYEEKDIERLMNDKGIVRNRLKINAVIFNAKSILEIQKEYNSFRKWIEVEKKRITSTSVSDEEIKKEWVKLFKNYFKFVGGEIVGEFLMSIGVLSGAHDKKCLVLNKK
jgi:DNA-3-methyladenine glycosylase I